jgi:hypothetical protein
MPTTTRSAALVQAYLAAWNETDAIARRGAIEAVLTPDVRYVDPLADVSGTDALDALIAGAQQQFPDPVPAASGGAAAPPDVGGPSGPSSAWTHPDRAVEADDLAVEHGIGHNVRGERPELGRVAQPGRVRHLRAQ